MGPTVVERWGVWVGAGAGLVFVDLGPWVFVVDRLRVIGRQRLGVGFGVVEFD